MKSYILHDPIYLLWLFPQMRGKLRLFPVTFYSLLLDPCCPKGSVNNDFHKCSVPMRPHINSHWLSLDSPEPARLVSRSYNHTKAAVDHIETDSPSSVFLQTRNLIQGLRRGRELRTEG